MAKEASVAPKERINIVYKPATGGAQAEKELPLKLLMLGDYTLQADDTPLEDRKRIGVDKDNFNDVMKRMTPGVNMRVENTMKGDGSEMAVNLKFDSMDDFEPAKVAEQVEPLKQLLDTRNKLRDLMSKVDRSEDLEQLLEQALSDNDQLKKLADELGVGSSSSDEGSDS